MPGEFWQILTYANTNAWFSEQCVQFSTYRPYNWIDTLGTIEKNLLLVNSAKAYMIIRHTRNLKFDRRDGSIVN